MVCPCKIINGLMFWVRNYAPKTLLQLFARFSVIGLRKLAVPRCQLMVEMSGLSESNLGEQKM